MIPMELPMEDVVVQTEESAQEEQIAEKPVTEKASNTPPCLNCRRLT